MRHAGRNLLLAVAGFGAATVVFGLSTSFALSLAMLFLTGIFDKAGVKRSDIEVKCFGGADMFPRAIEKSGLISVGRQNIMTAEALLKQEGLPIARQDVGGIGGRKLLFYPHTGEVLLQRLVGGREADVRRKQDGVPRHPAGMR
jgi:chemotaxis receptor (MCP) glutamine deamidase CheD